VTNKISQAVGNAAGKVVKTLVEDGSKAVKNFYHDTGKGLKKDAEAHVENDKKIATDLRNIGRRGDDETPVYHIDDDGNISRLHHNPDAENPEDVYTREKLTQADVDRLGIDRSSIGGPRSGESLSRLDNKSRSAKRPATTSSQVPVGTTDLARATQLARHADSSYGSARNGRFQSNNYAAARVAGANGTGDFIIVGRSHRSNGGTRMDSHSERMVGLPFLRQNEGARIHEMYSEREPCVPAPNCSAWIAERFDHEMGVSHSVEYGVTQESRDAGNAAMERYLNALKAAR
jgi:hypothetical protein